ncbi:MAG: transglutaminase [Flavobacterium sp.]|uniref:DUF3857 domain-containing protein n=1 Tax=Flavobacterium sp. TaxID=239 RepID=UPI000C46F2F7|nr:DUF3857 domain-containing protein [Flavobacterium sp.]MBF03301.1 transglutaminase [Flavobacterium sp.]
MKKKIYYLFIFLLFTVVNFAQKNELGEVTIEELKEKQYPTDPSAEAAILFEKGKTYFQYDTNTGFYTLTEVETKIKVYTKEGFEWATKIVPYYIVGNAEQRVTFTKAITYNLEEGKIVKTKLKSDGEFDEKKNKYWSLKKITMPNVKEGSIIEYKYTIKSPNYGIFPVWKFQYKIPVSYSSFDTYIPEYFVYNNQFKGSYNPVVETDSKTKTFSGRYTAQKNNPGGFSFDRESYEIEYKEYMTSYTLKNVPAIKEEKYVNNIENYVSSLHHELSSVQMPKQAIQNYSVDWESVVKSIMADEDFGNELKKQDYFKNDIDNLLKGITSPDEKIITIFEFVKAKMNWNKFYGYSCDEGVKSAYKNKVGNAAEINLMLTAMLKYAGIEANPVLISTRSNGIPVFPNRSAFNYVICGVELKENVVLLDATSKIALPDILPFRDLNWFGRLIRENQSSTVVNLIPKMKSNSNTILLCEINENAKITGKLRKQFSDYYAFEFRDKYLNVNKENYLEILENKLDGISISDYKIENDQELYKKITETFSFEDQKNVEKIGDKLYFSPLLFFQMKDNPFKIEDRNYPVDFNFPFKDSYVLNIKIPDNYEVEFSPEDTNLFMENNYGAFTYKITQMNTTLQIAITFEVNTPAVPSKDYKGLKSFYNMMLEKQSEKIILKKKI